MKQTILKLIKRSVSVLLCLFCCAMAPAMALQDDVFFPLQLPSIEKAELGIEDCALGSLTADALRTATGATFSIVCGGDLAGDLPQGSMTMADIEAVFSYDWEIAVADVTMVEFRALLETLLGHIVTDPSTEEIDAEASAFDGFPNVSGLTVVYDASAPEGERVISMTLTDGTALDLEDGDAVYTLAGSTALFSGTYGDWSLEAEEQGVTYSKALYDYIDAYGQDMTKLEYDRVTAIGAHTSLIVSRIPGVVLGVGLIVMMLCMVWINRRRKT